MFWLRLEHWSDKPSASTLLCYNGNEILYDQAVVKSENNWILFPNQQMAVLNHSTHTHPNSLIPWRSKTRASSFWEEWYGCSISSMCPLVMWKCPFVLKIVYRCQEIAVIVLRAEWIVDVTQHGSISQIIALKDLFWNVIEDVFMYGKHCVRLAYPSFNCRI